MENYDGIYEEPKGSVVMGILGAALGALIGAVSGRWWAWQGTSSAWWDC